MHQKPEKKRLFFVLLSVSLLLVMAVALLLLFFASRGKESIFFQVQVVVTLLLCGMIVAAGLGILSMVYIVLSRRSVGSMGRNLIKIAFFFYPAAMWLGKIFRLDRNKIRGSFIALNNNLIYARRFKIPADKIMVLLPHCLQCVECSQRVTNSLNHCVGCGRPPLLR